ncbi:MAG: TIGR00295 family protein [Hadesarchaea archaeon]|nr:TIGR00295 family protein [Hadesarchaea archaeon]
MLSRDQALQILSEEGCSPSVIEHSKAVSRESVKIAKKIRDNGHNVNIRLVEIGALLHDVGRSKTHSIQHGVKGAEILRKRGLENLAGFAENHLGAGIIIEESKELGLPEKNYLPESLEEKIVTYADNLLDGDRVMNYEESLNELKEELGPNHSGVRRFKKIHKEIQELTRKTN